MSEQAITLQQLSDKIDKLQVITTIGVKEMLSIEEAAVFTDYSSSYLYKMTSERRIPHFKRGGRLFFKKSELEHWLMSNKVMSEAEMESRAEAYMHFGRNRA